MDRIPILVILGRTHFDRHRLGGCGERAVVRSNRERGDETKRTIRLGTLSERKSDRDGRRYAAVRCAPANRTDLRHALGARQIERERHVIRVEIVIKRPPHVIPEPILKRGMDIFRRIGQRDEPRMPHRRGGRDQGVDDERAIVGHRTTGQDCRGIACREVEIEKRDKRHARKFRTSGGNICRELLSLGPTREEGRERETSAGGETAIGEHRHEIHIRQIGDIDGQVGDAAGVEIKALPAGGRRADGATAHGRDNRRRQVRESLKRQHGHDAVRRGWIVRTEDASRPVRSMRIAQRRIDAGHRTREGCLEQETSAFSAHQHGTRRTCTAHPRRERNGRGGHERQKAKHDEKR